MGKFVRVISRLLPRVKFILIIRIVKKNNTAARFGTTRGTEMGPTLQREQHFEGPKRVGVSKTHMKTKLAPNLFLTFVARECIRGQLHIMNVIM